MALNNWTPSQPPPFRPAQSLNQQIFWIILPWVMAPLLMLGITHGLAQTDSHQTLWFTVIFLAIGTISCGLAIVMVRRLSEDLHHLDREIARAASGNFTPVTPSHHSGFLQMVRAKELERLTTSTHQLIGNLQKSLRQQQAATAQTSLFSDLLALAHSHQDAPAVYVKAVPAVKKILGADRVFVYHFAPNWQGTIEAQAVSPNFSQLVAPQVADAFFTKSMVEIDQYRAGRILVVHDVQASGLPPERLAAYAQAQTQSNIVAPIMIRQRLVGLLCIQQCAQPRHWHQWEVDFGANIANFLGLVVDQVDVAAGNILTEQQTAQHLQLLSLINNQLSHSPYSPHFWVMLVAKLRVVLNLDRAIFFQLDTKFEGEITAESVDRTIKAIQGEKIVDTCLQTNRGCGYTTGRISAIDDIYTTDLTECHLQMMERLEIRANLVAPVIIDNSLHGLLIGHMSREPRQWQQSEIELLGQVAHQISLVLTKSALLQQRQGHQEQELVRDRQHKAAKENLQRQFLELIDKTEL
jgi:methyl-accepting chemotaxis protein PixJ